MDNKVGMLVKRAQGERTLKEYAVASGVNVTVLSKIINGRYTPKNKDIYEKLTSTSAAPRGGVTYEQLIEAVDSYKSSQVNRAAGVSLVATGATMLAVSGMPFAAVGALGVIIAYMAAESSKNKNSENKDRYNDIISGIKRFAATSRGIIFNSLAGKGISFKIETQFHECLQKELSDTYLSIENQNISEYIFRYVYYDGEPELRKMYARSLVYELTFLEPCKERKVSIVTNCNDVFDYLNSYKNKLSYNGDLSVILIDLDEVGVVDEIYISHFEGNNEENEIIVV